jgi:hypothetical protein
MVERCKKRQISRVKERGSYHKKYMRNPRRAAAIKPPSTPPTIAPTGAFLDVGPSNVTGSGMSVGTSTTSLDVSWEGVIIVVRVVVVPTVIYDVTGLGGGGVGLGVATGVGRLLIEHEVEYSVTRLVMYIVLCVWYRTGVVYNRAENKEW